MFLYGRTDKQLIAYFRTVLDVLKQHRSKLKLKEYKWFQDRCEFLGMYVTAGGTQLTESKNEAFYKSRSTKYMGRPLHAHWNIWILQPVLAPI